MTSTSPTSHSTPRSSSLLDQAVQELIELRAEKQRYQELQALLRQGLENLRKQQEAAEQAEFKYRRMLSRLQKALDALQDETES